MKQTMKKASAIMLAVVIMLSGVFMISQATLGTSADASTNNTYGGKTPKYIFMFIGDGMSYAQIAAATDYLGVEEYEGKEVSDLDLSFTEFEVTGTATTFDSTSFCPDSASTATSLSTGFKTYSGTINMDESKTIEYETIAEKLKEQKNYKIGIVSSVGINHATPAAYYAHQPTRGNYYEIGLELINSGFDYFGGGDVIKPTGSDKDQEDIRELAAEAGFTVPSTNEEILEVSSQDAPILAINPTLEGTAFPYELDRATGDLSLADFTRKGIDVLYNETGFFMMVEGGKIDWAGHANDAMANIQDTVAFADAVQEAVDFYNKYPDDTLIIVTGDHETGGLTMGYAGTGYSTYLDVLSNQTMSYEKFDYMVEEFRTNNTPFTSVMSSIKKNFGLMTSTDADAEANPNLVLSDYEYEKLEVAYTMSLLDSDDRNYTEADSLLYGYYDPLTVTLTHVLNNKAGIAWTSYSHTGVPVAVFAKGRGENLFGGYYDNTDIFIKLKELTNVN